MKEQIIGIDLGTTNSEVAIMVDGRIEVLEIENGSKLLPSVVGLADDGALLVGETACNQYVLRPDRTIRSVKRKMGEDCQIVLGDQHYTPQEISALILRKLKRVAEKRLGVEVSRAVITVPAFFSDAQRQATRDAGEIAGLRVERIINEPTAAALIYECGRHTRKQALVYDLGGGTFDVSVVRIEGDVVEVLASHGDNRLGGDDFDTAIVDHLCSRIKEQHGVDIKTSRTAMARLQRAAEQAKIALSDRPYVTINEEYLLEGSQPLHLSLELARDDYEAMIDPFVERTLEATHQAMEGAAVTASQIDEILLVGGSTRTPLIARRLEQELGIQPRGEVDPDLCVAMGAAVQAAIIDGRNTSSVLVDITPYTFGTSALSMLNGEEYPFVFVPLIRKNSPIPISKSEVFYTAFDGQRRVDIKVYQGEDPDALNNVEIGNFTIDDLEDVPMGNPIVTTFSLDLNGILQITTKEKNTGIERNLSIDNAISRFEEQDMQAARTRIDNLFEGDTLISEGELIGEAAAMGEQRKTQREQVQARSLIDSARKQLENSSEEDREDLIDLIERTSDAIAAGDSAALQEATNELSDLLFYLEDT